MTHGILFEHVDDQGWRWPHFSPDEFRCKCCKVAVISPRLLDVLEELREALGGKPLGVTSGYRCERYNKRVGGSPQSQHMLGRAADIWCGSTDRVHEVAQAARGIVKIRGIGTYGGRFVHVDVRDREGKRAEWSG